MTPTASTSYRPQPPTSGQDGHIAQPTPRPTVSPRGGIAGFRRADSALAYALREDGIQPLSTERQTPAGDPEEMPPEQNPLWIIVAAMACLFGVMAAVLALG